jgi:hypothetical protein
MSLETLFGPQTFTILSPEERDALIDAELAEMNYLHLAFDGPAPSIHVLTPRQVLTAISDDDTLSHAAE